MANRKCTHEEEPSHEHKQKMERTVETAIKVKLRKLQKLLHKSLVEHELTKYRDKQVQIISEVIEIDSNYFLKCSNCKVISDDELTFRSPFFNNDHFIMPVIRDEEFPSGAFSGVMKHTYPSNSTLYYADSRVLKTLLEALKIGLQERSSLEEFRVAMDEPLGKLLCVMSVLLPSSALATDSKTQFFEKQQAFFK